MITSNICLFSANCKHNLKLNNVVDMFLFKTYWFVCAHCGDFAQVDAMMVKGLLIRRSIDSG